MVWPLVPSPLGGNLGAFTASFFRLDPFGVAALEPLPDIVPGATPLRITFDMVDGETASWEYDVTEHAIMALADVTANVRKRLEQITITGTLGGTPPLTPLPAAPVPGSFARLDLVRLRNLKAMADSRSMVMVVTPRIALARAFITSIQHNWSPQNAESTMLTVTVREARLVTPLIGAALATDFPAQVPGNNAATGGGQSVAAPANVTATASSTPGVAPTIGAAP